MVSRGKEKMFKNCMWCGGLRLKDGIKGLEGEKGEVSALEILGEIGM